MAGSLTIILLSRHCFSNHFFDQRVSQIEPRLVTACAAADGLQVTPQRPFVFATALGEIAQVVAGKRCVGIQFDSFQVFVPGLLDPVLPFQHLPQRVVHLGEVADRVHVVVEVDDVEAARQRIDIEASPTQATSWGAQLFQLRDPDGVAVTFLQWIEQGIVAS